MTQVHKEQLTQVENAIAGRGGLDIEIFGMEGVPVEILDQHNMAVTEKHFADERARQAATGNPTRGSGGNGFTSKRPRTKETLEEILQNLEKWKADKKNGVLPPPIGEINNDQVLSSPTRQTSLESDSDSEYRLTDAYWQTPPPVNPFAAPAGVFPGQFPVGGFPLSAFPPAPPGGVPGVSGLPQRPPFGAPPPALFPPNGAQPGADFDASLNQLISDAQKPPTADAPVEKKSKKNINLVFFDDGDSPEEKMAALSKFAALART